MNSGPMLGLLRNRLSIEPARAPQRAQVRSANAFQLVMLLQHDERFQHRGRVAVEQVFRRRFEQLAATAETLIDRLKLRDPAAA